MPGKSVSIIVLSYFLFGLFILWEYGTFAVPVTYNDIIVFLIVLTTFLPKWKQLKATHYLLFSYAFFGFLIHPFLWEISLSQQQQFDFFHSIRIDIAKIIQLLSLILFFLVVSYDKKANKLKLEWLVPAVMSIGCFFYPAWYLSLVFIVSGLSAFYTLRRRTTIPDFFDGYPYRNRNYLSSKHIFLHHNVKSCLASFI